MFLFGSEVFAAVLTYTSELYGGSAVLALTCIAEISVRCMRPGSLLFNSFFLFFFNQNAFSSPMVLDTGFW